MNQITARIDAATEAELVPLSPAGVTTHQNANNLFGAIIRAAESGVDTDRIEKLMGLYDRVRESEAKIAFNEAFSAFKAEAIRVSRNRQVNDGPLKGRRYAELFSFVDAATPALSRNGLSHSWAITKDERDWIEVTCTIEHALGGSKQATLGGPPDVGGAKSALQARVSTVTYLERVTFKLACGLAEQGDDDDAQTGGGKSAEPAISDDQLMALRDLLDAADGDEALFCGVMKVESLAAMPASKFGLACSKLNARIKANAEKVPA